MSAKVRAAPRSLNQNDCTAANSDFSIVGGHIRDSGSAIAIVDHEQVEPEVPSEQADISGISDIHTEDSVDVPSGWNERTTSAAISGLAAASSSPRAEMSTQTLVPPLSGAWNRMAASEMTSFSGLPPHTRRTPRSRSSFLQTGSKGGCKSTIDSTNNFHMAMPLILGVCGFVLGLFVAHCAAVKPLEARLGALQASVERLMQERMVPTMISGSNRSARNDSDSDGHASNDVATEANEEIRSKSRDALEMAKTHLTVDRQAGTGTNNVAWRALSALDSCFREGPCCEQLSVVYTLAPGHEDSYLLEGKFNRTLTIHRGAPIYERTDGVVFMFLNGRSVDNSTRWSITGSIWRRSVLSKKVSEHKAYFSSGPVDEQWLPIVADWGPYAVTCADTDPMKSDQRF